ncbi:glycosyltransferase [Candidatus Kaiserbacteria bacterium]|nr:glycosyltransferase [Candidatus Kaiserbacteria bacterium]
MTGQNPLIGFIGQGYIGKNYADDFDRRGFQTVRYALEEPYRANKDRIKDCDIVFIAVPTPTTPEGGFDASIVDGAINLVGAGRIVVIKSTMLPGTSVGFQQKHPEQVVLFSPEFLSEATAAYDAANPFFNIIGMTQDSARQRAAAGLVHKVLPSTPTSITCKSVEAEIIKYTHNASAYTQIMFFNMMYDLTTSMGEDWSVVHRAVLSDPFIPNRYAQPVHKSGRGAGGHCFIKDYAALREIYEKTLPHDAAGIALMHANEQKNIALLRGSGKDLDLLAGVYGADVLAGEVPAPRPPESRIPVADIRLLVCAQSADVSDPTLGFFHAWVDELARRTKHVSLAYLQGKAAGLPDNVRAFSLGKDTLRGPKLWKRARYTVRFWWYAWRERREYDTVLVYINTEYVILGGLLWRLLGKKVAMISNAKESHWKMNIAAYFADVLFYTDDHAMAARLPRAQRIASGIATGPYVQTTRDAKPGSLLFAGRIAREKRLNTSIDAVVHAAKHTLGLHLDIYGAPVIADDRAFETELRATYKPLEEQGLISFCGSVPHAQTPQIYATHDIFVHGGSVTGFNKSLFEAMAAGCIVVTSEPSMRRVVREDLFVDEATPEAFARAIHAATKLSPQERSRESAALRAYVEREHALSVIIPNIFQAIYPSSNGARAIGV